MFINPNPVLGAAFATLAQTPTARRVERAQGLAGTSRVARALHQHWTEERVDGAAKPFVQHLSATGERFYSAPLVIAGLPFAAQGFSPRLARALTLAMIGAIQADGRIDGEERRRLAILLREQGATPELTTRVMAGLDRPVIVEEVAALTSDEEERVDAYAAAALACGADNDAERDYLRRLAAVLHLPAGVVAHLNAEAESSGFTSA